VTDQPSGPSAYYSAQVESFLADADTTILGNLTNRSGFNIDLSQREAWKTEIDLLKATLGGLSGTLFLEFDVPRLGSRIDAVIVSGPAVFPIEFKCGQATFNVADINQAWDYALDLKNFHAASHCAPIFPILFATEARHSDPAWSAPHADGVRAPYRCGPNGLRPAIDAALALAAGPPIDGLAWGTAPYRPTPTIVEAARTLYAKHSVAEISRNDAEARNLSVTSAGVEEVIERARTDQAKAIIFVTGVPGAGKTLVGLNIATKRQLLGETRAVYLSGNGPLVAVCRKP